MSNKSISQLTAGASVSSTDIFPDVQTAGVGPVKVTAAQIGNYVLSGSGLTGALPVANGGTGLTSLTAGYIPYASSSSAFSFSNLYSDGSNLGLGVTPSAWGTNQKGFQIANFASFWSDENAGVARLGGNVYQSGNTAYNYKYAGIAASMYSIGSGVHQWFTTGTTTGSAGGAISFTQAMTLDVSGNLGLNVSPNTWSAGKAIEIGASGNSVWSVSQTQFVLANNAYYNGAYKYASTNAASNYEQISGVHKWYTAASGTKDATISFGAAIMTLDASGNLLVGTTSAITTGSKGFQASMDGTGGFIRLGTSVSTIYICAGFYNSNGNVGSISMNGSATAFNTSSDIRLKTNITEAVSSLASILALPIRQFDWKSDGLHNDYGVVAQEAYDYAPEMVSQGDLWSVDYGRITPRLIKAFQELAAEVAELKAKVA